MNSITTTKAGFMSISNLDEAKKVAEIMIQSGLVPDSILKTKNPQASVLLVLQSGAELGLTPMNSLQGIAVINGKPMVWGDTLLALCKASPEFEYCNEWFDEKTNTAHCESKRRNQPPVARTFSFEEAKKAGLLSKSGTWQSYPKRMCQFRARNFSLRDNFADVLKGMRVVEDYIGHEDKELEINPINHTIRRVEEVPKEALSTMDSIKNKIKKIAESSAILSDEEIEERIRANTAAKSINALAEAVKASEMPHRMHERDKNGLKPIGPLLEKIAEEKGIPLEEIRESDEFIGEIIDTTRAMLDADEEMEKASASNRQQAPEMPIVIPSGFRALVDKLKNLVTSYSIPQQTVYKWLMKAQVEKLEDLTDEQINAIVRMIEHKKEGKGK